MTIETHAPMNVIDALSWLRRHRGSITFERDGTVSVVSHGIAKRADTVGDAMCALRSALAPRLEAK